MNYDEHQTTSDPGPIASQSWFVGNLTRVLKVVPKEKLICAIGNYGYDWTLSIPVLRRMDKARTFPSQRCSIPKISLSPRPGSAPLTPTPISISITTRSILTSSTSMKTLTSATSSGSSTASPCSTSCAPRASSAFNLRAVAARRGRQLAVERLGQAQRPTRSRLSAPCSPATTWTTKGEGDILRVTGLPQPGKRTVAVDTDEPDPRNKLIIDEHMDVYPRTYTVEHYGYHPNEVALSFDDGPDPKWTPKILDILKAKNVKGTFMMIGSEAAENIGLMQRMVREGNEIGNHTYTHPDISEISPRQLDLEVTTHRAPLRQQARRAAALLPPALRHRRRARHRRPGRARRATSSKMATPSSAARSTPTTGTSTRAKTPPRSSNPSSPNSRP